MTTPMPDYGLSFNDTTNKTSDSSIMELLRGEDYAKIFLHQQISDPNYKHELAAAQLWAIKKDNSFYLLAAHPDVYDLLSNEDYNLNDYKGIIIHTTGWAAPLGKDGQVEGRPSLHAERRRVALAACVYNGSVGSALSFADEDDIVTDPGTATGSLAEALQNFWTKNKYA